MKLYLMQHALAYPAEEKPERPLLPEGIDMAKKAAAGIRKLGLSFELIVTSSKRRSQQTAALVAEGVRYPYSDILSSETVLPNASPQAVLDLLREEDCDSVLIVGHLPHLAKLASHTLNGAELVFENTGLTCLELAGGDSAKLIFHLQAEQLAR